MNNIFYIILSFLLFSCTNQSINVLSSGIDVNISADLDATITVGEDIKGTGSETVILFIFRNLGVRYRVEGKTATMSSASPSKVSLSNIINSINPFDVTENAKAEAVYNAINDTNADLIINPQFKITEEDYLLYKTVTVEVTGKKGTIKTIK